MALSGIASSFWIGFQMGFGDDAPTEPKKKEQKAKAAQEELPFGHDVPKYLGATPILQPDYSYGVSPPKNKYWQGGHTVDVDSLSGLEYANWLKKQVLEGIAQDETITDQQRADRHQAITAFGPPWSDGLYQLLDFYRAEGSMPTPEPMPLVKK